MAGVGDKGLSRPTDTHFMPFDFEFRAFRVALPARNARLSLTQQVRPERESMCLSGPQFA